MEDNIKSAAGYWLIGFLVLNLGYIYNFSSSNISDFDPLFLVMLFFISVFSFPFYYLYCKLRYDWLICHSERDASDEDEESERKNSQLVIELIKFSKGLLSGYLLLVLILFSLFFLVYSFGEFSPKLFKFSVFFLIYNLEFSLLAFLFIRRTLNKTYIAIKVKEDILNRTFEDEDNTQLISNSTIVQNITLSVNSIWINVIFPSIVTVGVNACTGLTIQGYLDTGNTLYLLTQPIFLVISIAILYLKREILNDHYTKIVILVFSILTLVYVVCIPFKSDTILNWLNHIWFPISEISFSLGIAFVLIIFEGWNFMSLQLLYGEGVSRFRGIFDRLLFIASLSACSVYMMYPFIGTKLFSRFFLIGFSCYLFLVFILWFYKYERVTKKNIDSSPELRQRIYSQYRNNRIVGGILFIVLLFANKFIPSSFDSLLENLPKELPTILGLFATIFSLVSSFSFFLNTKKAFLGNFFDFLSGLKKESSQQDQSQLKMNNYQWSVSSIFCVSILFLIFLSILHQSNSKVFFSLINLLILFVIFLAWGAYIEHNREHEQDSVD
jgi:hypothetical protein